MPMEVLIALAASAAGFTAGLLYARSKSRPQPEPIITAPSADEVETAPEVAGVTFAVRAYDLKGQIYYTGQAWAWDGTHFVTNAHVLDHIAVPEHVEVCIGGVWVAAADVVWSARVDVAVITLADSQSVTAPDMAGLPGGRELVFMYQHDEDRMVRGRVEKDTEIGLEKLKGLFVTLTLPCRMGDSGSPVVNKDGLLVGMLTAVSETGKEYASHSYMLSAMVLRQMVPYLLGDNKRDVRRPKG
ncbi:MAG: hypothetical protein GC134_09490 [Proteobacteria bacterium]|nr:hypothetical protein [Pseudomonadota bacterium]